MQRILVTGGAGFIGSHLCDALDDRGLQVRVLDDLSTGSRANLRPDVDLRVGDVASPAFVKHALDGVDACFHLAAVVSVPRSATDWSGTHRVNQAGTITLFDAIRQLGSRIPVVYASSAAIYGDCPTSPITETAEKRPLSAYGADKYGCELHAHVASHVHGIPTVGLRFFNVYGPRQDPRSPYSGVISIFCQRIMDGLDIDIHGDGQQVRDFIYVQDVVATMLMALQRLPQTVLNVCTGLPTSVLTLASTIMMLVDKQSTLHHTAARSGDMRTALGSPIKMQSILGPLPPTPLIEGVREVLAWMAKERTESPSAPNDQGSSPA